MFMGFKSNFSIFFFSSVWFPQSKREMAPSKAVAARLFQLPSKYTFLKFLGEGAFAKVVKCLDEETDETVAIKLPKRWCKETRQEVRNLI